jgi:N-ethylmaleimide reductase
VIDACVAAIGASKVAIKLQPGVTFSDLIEPQEDVLTQLEYLGPQLSARNLAYVTLSSLNSEPYFRCVGAPSEGFLSVCLSVCLSVRPFVHLFFCLICNCLIM